MKNQYLFLTITKLHLIPEAKRGTSCNDNRILLELSYSTIFENNYWLNS